MSLAVVTDSAACLPAMTARAAGIRVIDLPVSQESDAAASTSRPSVKAIREAYAHALESADEVLALHLPAALSGTVDNARLAAGELGERVHVLDLGVSGGVLGMAALAASSAATTRVGAARARDIASRSLMLFMVDDVADLRRGGRVDSRAAAMGTMIGIRPILTTGPQGIRLVEPVRGKVRAKKRLIERAVEHAGGGAKLGPRRPPQRVAVAVHAEDVEGAEAFGVEVLQAMSEAGVEVARVIPAPIDPATAVHVGPGALGIAVAPAFS